jgi:integrase
MKIGRKNEGSVSFHKGTSRWYASFPMKNPYGKTIQKRAYCKNDDNTKKRAQELLLDLRLQAKDGKRLDTSYVLDFLTEWLELSKVNIRKSTFIDYEMTIRRYIKPYIDKIKLSELDEMMLEQFYAKLERSGITPRQRKKAHALIRAALAKALRWRKVNRNVAAGIDAPQYVPKKSQPLTDDQSKLLILAAKETPYFALLLLALDTGMRQGELFGLRWSDIDFKQSQLKVERSLSEVGGVQVFNSPKTLSGLRTVDISPTALNELQSLRKGQFSKGLTASGLVFVGITGKAIWKPSFHKNFWKPLLAKAGLAIRFHDLRHTAAVRMLERGLDPEVVRERLGHASISVTLGIYAHVTSKQRRAGAMTFETMLNEA